MISQVSVGADDPSDSHLTLWGNAASDSRRAGLDDAVADGQRVRWVRCCLGSCYEALLCEVLLCESVLSGPEETVYPCYEQDSKDNRHGWTEMLKKRARRWV